MNAGDSPMKSPFPGMDPYLEKRWRDVHARFVLYACDQLEERLPEELIARVEERVFVESPEGLEGIRYPDVHVVEQPGGPTGPTIAVSDGVAVADPVILHVPEDPVTQTFIEIREATEGDRLITVIEVLSPSNKRPGSGRRKYVRKLRELKRGRVSIVEIDLLRAGQRVLAHPPEAIPESHRTPYQVCVRRGWRPSDLEVYRVPFRDRLPVIPVPLREGEPDVTLDLQPLIEQAYRKGRYDRIKYNVEPEPPLAPDDAAWADSLLREKGLR